MLNIAPFPLLLNIVAVTNGNEEPLSWSIRFQTLARGHVFNLIGVWIELEQSRCERRTSAHKLQQQQISHNTTP